MFLVTFRNPTDSDIVDGMMGFNGKTCTNIVELQSSMKVNLEKPCVGM